MLTDGHTDIRTYGRTDRPSYRDARTHLKMKKIERKKHKMEEETEELRRKKKKKREKKRLRRRRIKEEDEQGK